MMLCNDVSSSKLAYDKQLAMFNRLYAELDISVKAKTHGRRRAGARFLEERG